MSGRYDLFEIRVAEKSEGFFPVTAFFRAGSWKSAIPDSLPLFSKEELERAQQWLERGFIDRQYSQDFGKRLFQTLFSGEVRQGFRDSCQMAYAEGAGVRIILTLPQDLAGLPWELIYDAQGSEGFLARSVTTPMSRYSLGKPIPHKPPEEGPLRILVVAASPESLQPIGSEQEMADLKKSIKHRQELTFGMRIQNLKGINSWLDLRALRQGYPRIEMDLLPNATRQSLQERLADASRNGKGYHVLHFIGHGQADSDGSQIILELPDQQPDPVPAMEFAEIVATSEMCLVVLNACQTASAVGVFDSLAEEIMKHRVPAVIGMQVQVLDRAALDFARAFYSFWAAGEPIEIALAYARRMMSRASISATADWGIPVLFMGSSDGLRLSIKKTEKPPLFRRILSVLNTLLITVIPTFLLYWGIFTALPKPVPMTGGFNIAVAEFGELGTNGQKFKSTAEGKFITQKIVETLGSKTEETTIQVLGQPVIIQGGTPKEREASAQELANQVHANVIIYGWLDKTDKNLPVLFPEVFISEQFADIKDLSDNGGNASLEDNSPPAQINSLGELVGAFRFGERINFRTPLIENPKNAEDLASKLVPRLEALSWFTLGLAQFYNSRYDQAIDYLAQAENAYEVQDDLHPENPPASMSIEELPAAHAPRSELAVLYLFHGAALFRRGNEADILVAEKIFNKLLAVTQYSYARAYLGLGNLAMVKALSFGYIDEYYLDEAINDYQQALDVNAKQSVPDQYLPAKAHFDLGIAQVYKAQLVSDDCPNQKAADDLQMAIDAYKENPDILLMKEIGAKSYYQLGLLYSLCADRRNTAGLADQALPLYALAGETYKQGLIPAEPPLVPQPGWLGLPIGRPEPVLLIQNWHSVRYEIKMRLAYTLIARAELGDSTLYAQALPYLANVVETFSRSPDSTDVATAAYAYFNLGLVYEKTGEVEQAINAYKNAKQTDPQNLNLAARVDERLQALEK